MLSVAVILSDPYIIRKTKCHFRRNVIVDAARTVLCEDEVAADMAVEEGYRFLQHLQFVDL